MNISRLHFLLFTQLLTDNIFADKPSPPRDLKVTEVTEDSVNLSWSPPEDDGGTPITGYVVERLDMERRNWKRTATTIDTRSTVINLIEGQAYKFRVCAENKVGLSEPVETPESVVAKKPYDLPGAPSKPTIEKVAGPEVTLTWTPPDRDGGSPITGYYVERRQLPSSRWVRITDRSVTELTYIATSLLEKQEYEFRVVAENKAGTGPPSVGTMPIRIKPLYERPSPPKDITPEVTAPSSITVSWSPPEDDGGTPVTHYTLEVKSSKDFSWKPAPEDATETSYVFTNLKPDADYTFRVRAVNKVGPSDTATSQPITLEEPKPVGEPPKIKPLQESPVSAVEGDEVTITFEVTGEPEPEVTWRKAGKLVKTNGERVISSDEGTHTVKMVLPKVEPLHSATYSIEAVNPVGKDKVEFTVDVKAPPKVDVDQPVLKVNFNFTNF